MSRILLLQVLMAGSLGFSAMAGAQAQATPTSASTDAAAASTAKAVPAPGDRGCLRNTGSLIPAKPGHCLPVSGRSYSGKELLRTGEPDTARALQQLDPSISVGH